MKINHKHKFEFVGICQHPIERRVINLLGCECGAEKDGFTGEEIKAGNSPKS